jgi:hypothetical protein
MLSSEILAGFGPESRSPTAADRAMAGLLSVFSELENAILRERVRAAEESGRKGSTLPLDPSREEPAKERFRSCADVHIH